jgi:peroxiredoxin
MKKLISLLPFAFILTLLSNGAMPSYKAGDFAEDFSLKNVDGKMVSLSQFENAKGFIVVFMCNTCPVVKKYEQRIIDLNKEFSSKGYPVIAINSNDRNVSPGDSFEDMQKTAKSKGYDFQYLYDESQEVAKRFGATNTPHVYVLTKEGGKLKVEYVGAIDNNADNAASADKKYVEDAVNDLINGQHIAVTGTRAVGCGIKWKRT